MSGGSFDYAYSRVTSFVYDLDDRLNDPEYGFSPGVMTKLREIKAIAENTSQLMRAVEWLYSGDDSEECFLRKFEKSSLAAQALRDSVSLQSDPVFYKGEQNGT